MSVVAMTANVKVLILPKEEIALFPEDVQREIVNGLRISKNIEQPYSEAGLDEATQQF